MPLTPTQHKVIDGLQGRDRITAAALAEQLGLSLSWTVIALYDLATQGRVHRHVEGHENAVATWTLA